MSPSEAVAAQIALNHVSSYTYELDQDKFEASIRGVIGDGKCIHAVRKGIPRKMSKEECIQFMRENHWSNVQKIELLYWKVIANGATPSVELNTRQTHNIDGKTITAEVPTTVSFVMDVTGEVPKIKSITYDYAPQVDDQEVEAKLVARVREDSEQD